MERYELIPTEILDKILERVIEIKQYIENTEDTDCKMTEIAKLDGIYNAIQKERVKCDVMPYREF